MKNLTNDKNCFNDDVKNDKSLFLVVDVEAFTEGRHQQRRRRVVRRRDVAADVKERRRVVVRQNVAATILSAAANGVGRGRRLFPEWNRSVSENRRRSKIGKNEKTGMGPVRVATIINIFLTSTEYLIDIYGKTQLPYTTYQA